MDSDLQPGATKLRLLVAIACYGSKNAELLQRVIRQYQTMDLEVDIVVLSNVPRDLGSRVRVIVGLPSENPWSLPFAHKAVFAENVDRYDLFAYSEDDMGVTEQNIRAFERASPHLASDEIAGFLRYEVDQAGSWSLPDVHGGYHWKPDSAKRRSDYTIAEFTNDHAGFYLITRNQLTAMIARNGFVRGPYEGRYDMLCSAATDPYTAYGFRKVVCISALDDFLVHHLSNRYAGQMGISLPCVRKQIEALLAVAAGTHVASTLFQVDTPWPDGKWAKNFYEDPDPDVLALIPEDTRTLLSLGCGWGATETLLIERGIAVTAVPINSIIATAAAARPGFNVEYGSFEECLSRLHGQVFDCVLMTDLLHLLPDPQYVIEAYAVFMGEGHTMVIAGPNFGSLRVLGKRAINKGGYRKLRSFEESGINLVGPGLLKRYLKPLGFEISAIRWSERLTSRNFDGKLGRWGSANWVMQARRRAARRSEVSIR